MVQAKGALVEQGAEHQERSRPKEGRAHEGHSHQPEHGLKSFICQLNLVDSLGSCVPSSRISVCGLSEGHSGDLALDVQLEASAEFYHQGPEVCVSGIRGQDQEAVQVIIHCLVSFIVQGPFQSIDIASASVFEEGEGPEDFLLVTAELL